MGQTTPAPKAAAAATPSLAASFRSGLVLMLVATVPPLVIARVALGPAVVTICIFGSLVGLLNTLMGGPRVGLMASGIFILMVPVALTVGSVPLAGACLIALVCVIVGASARWKRYGGLYEIPLGMIYLMTLPASAAAAMPGGPSLSGYLPVAMGVAAFATLWAVGGTQLLYHSKGFPITVHHTTGDSLRYLIVMTVLVSVSTLFVLAYAREHGVWLVLTLFMVLQVDSSATRHRAVQRVAGTVVAALMAALVASVTTQEWVIGAILVLAFVGVLATISRPKDYPAFTFFITTVILLGTTPLDATVGASFDRLAYTLGGAALALAAMAIMRRLPDPTRALSLPAKTP
jgi:hypothetical protein